MLATSTPEIEMLLYDKGNDGQVKYDGKEVWVLDLSKDGQPILFRFVNGKADESYSPGSDRLPIYLAAIAGGYEPPRSLVSRE